MDESNRWSSRSGRGAQNTSLSACTADMLPPNNVSKKLTLARNDVCKTAAFAHLANSGLTRDGAINHQTSVRVLIDPGRHSLEC